VSTGREQSIHCIDILRPNVDKAIGLLGEVFCNSLFLEQDVEVAKQTMELLRSLPETFPPELQLQECLMMAAYGEDQQLGKTHVCPPQYIPHLNAEKAKKYWQAQVLDNPHNMVVGGAGVEHDQLCRLVETYFGHLKQNDETVLPTIPSQYRGGSKVHTLPWPDNLDLQAELFGHDISEAEKDQRLTRMVLGLEVGGWHSQDLVAVCVLQTLLGGGSSFSAGGPGKGMYSRLYRKVLNGFRHVESAESFTAFHGESGLWGISGSIRPDGARGLLQVFCQQLKTLAVQPVTDEEIVRARNMLKGNVLTQLESRLVIFEDISRQVLTYGKRESTHETCEKIDAVTKEDLMKVAAKAMEKPPTLAAVGIDVSNVPKYEEVQGWFQ
jgi:processing peptidase subunit alpha